jgi:hypothetical protein
MGHEPRFIVEANEFDRHFDNRAEFAGSETVPELIQRELTISLRKTRIQNQLKCSDEIAFSNLILTDEDEAVSGGDIKRLEVCKVVDLDSTNAQPAVPLNLYVCNSSIMRGSISF